jgi:hypothetical protein
MKPGRETPDNGADGGSGLWVRGFGFGGSRLGARGSGNGKYADLASSVILNVAQFSTRKLTVSFSPLRIGRHCRCVPREAWMHQARTPLNAGKLAIG